MTHDKPAPGQDAGLEDSSKNPLKQPQVATKPSENLELQMPKNEQKLVDFGSDQSFPASDPPAHDIVKVKEEDAGNAGSQ